MDQHEKYAYDRSFQQRIITLLLRDPAFLKEYSDVLSPAYFEVEALAIVTRVTLDFFSKHGETPVRDVLEQTLGEYFSSYQVSDRIKSEVSATMDIVYSESLVNLQAVKDRVVKFGRRQALKNSLFKIAEMVHRDEDYDKAREILNGALGVGSGTRNLGFSIGTDLLRLPNMAKKSTYAPGQKIPTLWPVFDRYTGGGPARREVWIVGALSGVGKSTCTVQLGVSALLSGHNVVHYTVGDLDDVDVGLRYGARLTGCKVNEIISNSESYQKRATARGKLPGDIWIKHFSSGQAKMSHIRSHLSQLKYHAGFKPDMVIIDYPDELSLEENTYRDIGAIYAEIQAIAYDYDAVTLAASQVKTDVIFGSNRNKPGIIRMESLDHSKLKYTKCDGMFSLNQTIEERREGKMRLWVDKCRRYSAQYLLEMSVDYSVYSIREVKEMSLGSEKK